MNLHVGGFNVHASTDGGIDTAGLKNQVVDRVKSTLLWWAFGILAVIVVLAALGGYGYYAYKHTPKPPRPLLLLLRRRRPRRRRTRHLGRSDAPLEEACEGRLPR